MNSEKAITRLDTYLKDNNLKMTAEREEVLQMVLCVEQPFNIRRIRHEAEIKRLAICHASIYNITRTLLDAGIITSVPNDKNYREYRLA